MPFRKMKDCLLLGELDSETLSLATRWIGQWKSLSLSLSLLSPHPTPAPNYYTPLPQLRASCLTEMATCLRCRAVSCQHTTSPEVGPVFRTVSRPAFRGRLSHTPSVALWHIPPKLEESCQLRPVLDLSLTRFFSCKISSLLRHQISDSGRRTVEPNTKYEGSKERLFIMTTPPPHTHTHTHAHTHTRTHTLMTLEPPSPPLVTLTLSRSERRLVVTPPGGSLFPPPPPPTSFSLPLGSVPPLTALVS